MSTTAEERADTGAVRCELCDDHTEPDMGRMHDHLTDEHDYFTKKVNEVTSHVE